MGFFDDVFVFPFEYFFPIMLACFVGSWLGLVPPVWLFRTTESHFAKIIAGSTLFVGLIIAVPQLLNQAIYLVDMTFEERTAILFWYNLSSVLSLFYLGIMTLLLPLWVRLIHVDISQS